MTAPTLTEFLLARIAEDEAVASEATNDGHRWLVEEETISLWPDDLDPATGHIKFPRKAHAYHAATWEPARVLAECEAKRSIVEELTCVEVRRVPTDRRGIYKPAEVRVPYTAGYDESANAEDVLRRLATAYADHPDYDEAWRP